MSVLFVRDILIERDFKFFQGNLQRKVSANAKACCIIC